MIPLWLKITYTLFVCALVPIYWRQYGPANFLWFSDIALLALVPALWLESPLLVSMMALAIVLPELAWNIDYFFRLATGVSLIGLTNYMFDASIHGTFAASRYSTWRCRCCSSGCFTGSATIAAPCSGKRSSLP